MENHKKSRRAFFSILSKNEDAADGETIKMLTPDGELVEVKKNSIKNKNPKKKTSNQDILKWMNKKS